jgi:menin
VRAVANAVWAKAIPKPNVRDELHANSLYVLLRGHVDKRSLDCFGAAVVTISGLYMLGYTNSMLTLSEDHAYERHTENSCICTCEMAVPGNTLAQRQKRGREIAATFSENKQRKLTPETSWLYMASNPVVCDSTAMALVAVMGNINCTIEKRKGSCLASRQLYEVKRELLWVLYDAGHMKQFPFGMMELGDCEEHCGSMRGEEWVTVPGVDEPILVNEKLFREAIQVSRDVYNDAQVYPYYYAGHYHKDAGNEGPESEYRLVEAMHFYAQAARVTSKYRYDPVDSIQLNKHCTAAAMLIVEDILTPKDSPNKKEPRRWIDRSNAVAVCTQLLVFFDWLLHWEEQSDSQHFVEILHPSHQFSIQKMFQLLPQDVRVEANNKNFSVDVGDDRDRLQWPRSKRMNREGLLIVALQKEKVTIREMDLAVPTDGNGRRSKRSRQT